LHNGQLTEPFQTISGVPQGCLLSPLLFLVVLDGVLNEVFSKKARGISWRSTQTLEDLDYANNICLLSHKRSDMQENDLNYESMPGSIHVGFVVDKVALGQVFLLSSLVFPCQYHSTVALQTHIIWEMRNMLA
jgi:hypothetical protein